MRSRREHFFLRVVWSLWSFTLGTLAFGQAVPSKPLESWADPGLKTTRGLALWLDAGRVNAARKAHGLPEVSDGVRVDRWHDASGQGRDFAQARREAQPEWYGGGLRFDGEAAHLEATAHFKLKEFTLFVVAAPFRDIGGFPSLFAMNQKEQEDYTSGLTVDLGPLPAERFANLNVEGKGFIGANNLLDHPSEFDFVRRIVVTSAPGKGGTKLLIDGVANKSRDRAEGTLEVDQLLVGARRYGFPPYVQGFFDGDVFQVLLYDRVLDESECKAVDAYLASRIGTRGPIVHHDRPKAGSSLVRVENPPPVQVLAPGFVARELPIDLPNVNNVKYRADGKLVALTYGGDVFLLSDQDGDGIEETSVPFFEADGKIVAPIGMALTPADYPLGDGVFVASKGKVSLILDSDRDGKADEEKIIASGWTPLWVTVDALGVAVDREGNIYFGLGTDNFIDPRRIDRATGKAAYRLTDLHGTIQKISPDFKRRETVATGLRFPVALAINQAGDLFGTDQEGATWVPNGNPFDELLHIQTGRHYGFPPRHPIHLPTVHDEPSVFDYGPQHQSACGLNFNEPVNGGPVFGPASWAGDAWVAGYSRGKLWRTELIKTPAGYVARNRIFAVLSMLTVDACVSPQGALVVSTHSGLPDWGSGPKGRGKLYKIIYEDREAPQPVIAWPAGPTEVRVAFDRPLDPERLKDLSKSVAIDYGEAVRAADRFESLRPGYMIVARQLTSPRARLAVLSTQIPPDRRSIVLTTTPHPSAVSYALTLPGLKRPGIDPEPGALRQVSAVDLDYDLSGVEATWTPEHGTDGVSSWLPHLDLAVARRFTAQSFEHDRLWEAMKRPGRLTLKTKLDLWQMLRPAIQPGSDPGYTLPDEEVTVELSSSGPIEVTADSAKVESLGPKGDGRYHARVVATPRERNPLPIRVVLETGAKLELDATYSTREDARPRAFQPRRFLLPWASLERRLESVEAPEIPELKGGDWARGRALFSGEEARCSTCHSVRGHGGRIGPDLSNLIHRDYASVLRDIHTPNAAINPDYIAYAVELKDGRVLQGAVQTENGRVIVSDTNGRQIAVAASDVERMTASSASIMPEGLDKNLGPAKMRDLLTFLLTAPLQPAPIERESPPAPPVRSRAEVDAAMAGSTVVEKAKRLTVVLTDGPKDHGAGEHDYPLWRKRWEALLATDETVAVETAGAWPSPSQLQTADVVVLYSNNPSWNADKAAELDGFLARGGGLVLIHFAVDGHKDASALADRIGLAWGGKPKFRHGPLEVDFSKSMHPVARNLGILRFVDESYWNLLGKTESIDVIGTGVEEGQAQPLFWAKESGQGRVFVSIPGHYTWTFDDPLFRLLILRGIAWTAGEPVDRFNGLATLGARVEK